MIAQSDFDNLTFTKFESDKFEFKESIIEKVFDKYLETICGFLNTNPGYLIFGIKDNLELVGLKLKSKEIDKFILRFDSIINSSQIVGINKLTNQIINLTPTSIKQTIITNKFCKQFLAIEVIPEPNIKYQLANGKIYYRLGASNYFEKNEKFFKQSDFDNACKQIQINAEQENKTNIELFQKTFDEKNKQIEELGKNLNKEKEINIIYQEQLELSIKNSDKLVKYNSNNNVLIDIIKILLPCMR
jgi:predicted HTH transcriptional regulator